MSKAIAIIILASILTAIARSPLTDIESLCTNFNSEFKCTSDTETSFPESLNENKFQTPRRNQSGWLPNYEDQSMMTGYIHTEYNAELTEATLTFNINVNKAVLPQDYTIYYYYGLKNTTSTTVKIRKDDTYKYRNKGMKTKVKIFSKVYPDYQIAMIRLEKWYFIWDNPEVKTPSQFENGSKGVIIEMFGWPYLDIEKECEFIGRAGYWGVKIYPPEESVLTFEQVENGEWNPWWYLYQPVSYRLTSRHGDEVALKRMTKTCRRNNVRVYIDTIINHMSGNGNDINEKHRSYDKNSDTCNYWYNKSSIYQSPYFTHSGQYKNNINTNKRTVLEYPSVPYTVKDFHCERDINDENNPHELNFGWLFGWTDLKTESEYVRERIADYFTSVISIGVSGFRIDAARNVGPDDQAAIYAKVKRNLGGKLPDDFLIYLQLFLGLLNEQSNWLMCDRSSNLSFSYGLVQALQNEGFNESDIDKFKVWTSDYPRYWPVCGTNPISDERTAVGMETIDDQIPGVEQRDWGEFGSVFLVDKDKEKHKKFEIEILKNKSVNFKIKLLMSSYSYKASIGAFSFPDGYSDCKKCISENCRRQCKKSVPYNKAFSRFSRGYDTWDKNGKWIEGTYTRVHRDYDIVSAVREWMGLPVLSESELYE